MKLIKAVRSTILLILFAASFSFSAENQTPEQQEIKQFIEKMYSYDPDTFFGGYFDAKTGKPFLRNRVPKDQKRLKYDPNQRCVLLREFFEESIIVKRQVRANITTCEAWYIYLNLDDENRSSVTRYIDIPAPKIGLPVVKGNNAKVSVLTEGEEMAPGRSLFFLTKTDNGWRVSNVMTQSRLSKSTDERDECYYSFAKKPSTEEFKEVAVPCRQSLPAAYRP